MRSLLPLALISTAMTACAPTSAPVRVSLPSNQPIVATVPATAVQTMEPPAVAAEAPADREEVVVPATAKTSPTPRSQPVESAAPTRPRIDPNELASERGFGTPTESAPARVRVAIGSASITGGAMESPDRVIAGLASSFRACYERGLDDAPTSQGTLRLKLRIGADGGVIASTGSVQGDLTRPVVACVRGLAAAVVYPVPKGGGATLEIPITFAPME